LLRNFLAFIGLLLFLLLALGLVLLRIFINVNPFNNALHVRRDVHNSGIAPIIQEKIYIRLATP